MPQRSWLQWFPSCDFVSLVVKLGRLPTTRIWPAAFQFRFGMELSLGKFAPARQNHMVWARS